MIGFSTAIGFVFAVLAQSVSVVSFPMLLDRDVDVPIAIQTSVKAVLMNAFTMALWGLIVAGSLAIGFLLVFAGLAVVVPVGATALARVGGPFWTRIEPCALRRNRIFGASLRKSGRCGWPRRTGPQTRKSQYIGIAKVPNR